MATSKQFNPIGHSRAVKDIFTTYDISESGLRVLLNAHRYTGNGQPNYWLIHPMDFERLKRQMFERSFYLNHEPMTHFEGIKIVRSKDLQIGQIQLI